MDEIWSKFGRFLEYMRDKTLTTPSSKARNFIKIVHSGDVKNWESIPSYEELDTLTLSDYLFRRNELSYFKQEIPELIKAEKRKAGINIPDPVEYAHFEEIVPSDLFRRDYIIQLRDPIYENTEFHSTDGNIEGCQLIIKRGWKKKLGDRWKLDQCANSVFNQPILFISHRWESSAHPDPKGKQLEKISRLEDCFFIYDYFSFPQDAKDEISKAKLNQILEDMTSIICNVIILYSDSYIERGWCPPTAAACPRPLRIYNRQLERGTCL